MNDKNDKTETQQVKHSSPGAMLRTAREAGKLSVEHIASQLRLSRVVIEDIENDRIERLPAPIFVRGYIKSYAALVGLDTADVMASYEQHSGQTDQKISLDAARATSVEKVGGKFWGQNVVPVVAAGLVLILGAILWYSQKPEVNAPGDTDITMSQTTESQQTETSAELQESPGPVEETESSVADSGVERVEAIQQETVADKVEVEQQQKAISQKVDSVKAAENEVVEVVKPRIDRLEFVFFGDSWVDVMDSAGERLIYRMVKSGERRTVSGVPPFKITLGNAPQTQLSRNGQAVDLNTYTRGNVAKFSLGKINE
jgi:cytoskeleton protein RodZ